MGSTRVTTYSADEVVLTFAGQQIDSGFDEGDFVQVEMAADAFGDVAGADGEVGRNKILDKRATIKIKLLQTSLGNNLLQQIHARDVALPNGAGVGVFQVVDRSSGTVVAFAEKAWISKPPGPARGKEIKINEWTLRAAHMKLDLSGNPSI